jgi:uncharacterized protein YyaL (SSP411 family)
LRRVALCLLRLLCLQWALQLQGKMDELFWDEAGGGYFSNPEGDASILLRMKV